MLTSWKNPNRTATARTSDPATGAWDAGGQVSFDAPKPGILTGIAAGMLLATPQGWRKVDDLRPGDMVLTFDDGMQPIAEIRRGMVKTRPDMATGAEWPLFVPAGALGNADDILLMPEQTVMVESDLAEEYNGDPFVLLPAAVLEGVLGITRCAPADAQEIICLSFETDQIVFANGSALMLCPSTSTQDLLDCGGYQVLGFASAQAVVQAMDTCGAPMMAAPQELH